MPRRPMSRRRYRILMAAFLAASALSLFFAGRFVVQSVYWSMHSDEPIEAWMTLGYIAHSYDVPPRVLYEVLDLPEGVPDRRPLAEIAAASGQSVSDVRVRLEGAIAQARASGSSGSAAPLQEHPP